MRIGIDARMSGPTVGGGGLGRYVEQLVKWLPTVDQENRYVLFGRKELGSRNKEVGILESKRTEIPWYTLKEQLLLPQLIDREQLNLVHFPHWNVPIRLKTPFVVTIHDLILLEQPRSARATTRHPLIYLLKYAGFKRVLAHAVRASKKIIAVSQATKSDILKHFPDVPEEKIVVIYEGITPFQNSTTPRLSDFPYLLYLGNAYPHKNLETLLSAFELLHASHPQLHLVLAGRDDIFLRRFKETDRVHVIRNPDDAMVAALYAGAHAYVFPSLIEGFGLPPLEAMSQNVPVACSDIPSLREVLGDAAAYFNPKDATDMACVIGTILDDRALRTKLIQQGMERIKRYSWKAMAEQTVRIYTSCAH